MMIARIEPGFTHLSRAPLGLARTVVEEVWLVEAERCRTAVEVALPDPAVELYFNLGPTGRQPFDGSERDPAPRGAWVAGPRARPLLIAKETRECRIVGVRFKPGTAARILGGSARELVGSLIDLDRFWGAEVAWIRERLARCHPEARLDLIERVIEQRVARDDSPDDAERAVGLAAALERGSQRSIHDIARAFGLSHRRVIELFDRHVGLKPKTYQRVSRLRRVMEAIGRPVRSGGADLAARHGYFDQAHLIHEFQNLTAMTPLVYAATRSSVGHGFVPYRLGRNPSSAGKDLQSILTPQS